MEKIGVFTSLGDLAQAARVHASFPSSSPCPLPLDPGELFSKACLVLDHSLVSECLKHAGSISPGLPCSHLLHSHQRLHCPSCGFVTLLLYHTPVPGVHLPLAHFVYNFSELFNISSHFLVDPPLSAAHVRAMMKSSVVFAELWPACNTGWTRPLHCLCTQQWWCG